MFPLYNYKYEIPVGENVGSYNVRRSKDIHCGVDLYCEKGDDVICIEDGTIVGIEDFTGSKADSPWWNDTQAVLVEGASGVILYGELKPYSWIKLGNKLKSGDRIGEVTPVLKKDKGVVPSISMLHIELYKHGTTKSVWWKLDEEKPDNLLDITPMLIENYNQRKKSEAIAKNIIEKLHEIMTVSDYANEVIEHLDWGYPDETPDQIKEKFKDINIWGEDWIQVTASEIDKNNSDNYMEFEHVISFFRREHGLKNCYTMSDREYMVNEELYLELEKQVDEGLKPEIFHTRAYLCDDNFHGDYYATAYLTTDFELICFGFGD